MTCIRLPCYVVHCIFFRTSFSEVPSSFESSLKSLRWRHNGAIASQITSFTIVYSIAYSDADQRKHQSSASLAFVQGIHRGPGNSPHKWPVTRIMLPFDDVIMWHDLLDVAIDLPSRDLSHCRFPISIQIRCTFCFASNKILLNRSLYILHLSWELCYRDISEKIMSTS